MLSCGRSAPGTEALTRLGRHLAALPLPPAAGKLLLYGLLFRCLDPLLTIACGLAYRCDARCGCCSRCCATI